jgi:PST family polysaccharide transporter
MRASAWKFSQKVLGEGGLRLISTLFVLLLARHLGADDFGRYSSALAYAALCIVFVDLGTNAILTREIARYPDRRLQIAESSHSLKALAALGSWLILLAVTYALRFSPENRRLTLCLGVVVIGQTLTEYFSALLNGIEEMGWEAVLKVLCRTLGLGLGFLALFSGKSVDQIVQAMAWGTLASYLAAVGLIQFRFGRFGFRADVDFLKSLCRASLPLFACVLFWILYDSQDILLLNYFHFSQRDIGLFSAAMKIIDVLRVYPVLIMGVFFPTLARLHLSDPEEFRRKQRRLLIFVGGSLLGGAACLYTMAPWIIRLLYKSDFAAASDLLRLLAPALVGMGLAHVQMQTLIALNQERKLLAGAFITCACNLLFACLLLPRLGVAGVCYALIGSEIVYFLFLRWATSARQENHERR